MSDRVDASTVPVVVDGHTIKCAVLSLTTSTPDFRALDDREGGLSLKWATTSAGVRLRHPALRPHRERHE